MQTARSYLVLAIGIVGLACDGGVIESPSSEPASDGTAGTTSGTPGGNPASGGTASGTTAAEDLGGEPQFPGAAPTGSGGSSGTGTTPVEPVPDGGGETPPDCSACLSSACASELSTCTANASCPAVLDCAIAMACTAEQVGCVPGCARSAGIGLQESRAVGELVNAVLDCAAASCAAACGLG